MSEVSGRIVILAQKPESSATLRGLHNCYNLMPLEHLASVAGISLELDNTDLEIEESLEESGFAFMSVFGGGWIEVLRQLLAAKGIQFWAVLWDEDGIEYYFSLVEGRGSVVSLSLETGDISADEAETIREKWLQSMPDPAEEWLN